MFYSDVFGIVSAMVGAGFASGREIMHFFSRYGAVSWVLAALAVLFMGVLMAWLMEDVPVMRNRKTMSYITLLLLPLFTAVGGAMTAAAGELAALSLPLFHARALGGWITLCAGVLAARKPVKVLGVIGKILVPLLLLAFFFCLRIPAGTDNFSACKNNPLFASIQLAGYCGLNVTISAGVIREAGHGRPIGEQKRISRYSCILIGLLLCVGNAALLPHAASLQNAALPVVMVLRSYGKAGFYLSVIVLYLAVLSTLAAILRITRSLFANKTKQPGLWAGLVCAASSMLGFEKIVGLVYPILGWLGILLIFGKKFSKNGTICFAASSIRRKPIKEETNR